jgi:hypothetical protein
VINRVVAFPICLVALIGVALPVAQAESGDTRIKLRYGIKAKVAENRGVLGLVAGTSGIARHNYTILLKPNGEVTENYEGAGRFVLVKKNESTLGSDGQSLQYRVVDESTIQRINQNDNLVQTITIRVNGKSCRIEYQIELKPGKKVFVAFSQSRGQLLNYRSFELVENTCTIE